MSEYTVNLSAEASMGTEMREDQDNYFDTPFNHRQLAEEIEYLVLAIQCLPKKRRALMNRVFLDGHTPEGETEKTHYKLGVKDIKEQLTKWGVL